MCVECLIEFSNVRMIEPLHDLDFSLDPFPAVWFKQLELFVDLARNFLVGLLVQAQPDNRISTLTNSLAYYIVVEVFCGATLCAKLVRIDVVRILKVCRSDRAILIILLIC